MIVPTIIAAIEWANFCGVNLRAIKTLPWINTPPPKMAIVQNATLIPKSKSV